MAGEGLDAARAIRQGARALGIRLSMEQVRSLVTFLEVVRAWNSRFRLVGTDDPRLQINKHIIDSLLPGSVLRSARSLIDVGTGGGLPGIPLCVSCPHLSVTLVDSRRSRANFVRDAIRRLNLRNARMVEARIEELVDDPATRGSFDATIARAWAPLPRFLEVSAGLLRAGGIAVSMKGPKVSDEIAAAGGLPAALFGAATRKDYCLPEGGGRRTLLVFVRGQAN